MRSVPLITFPECQVLFNKVAHFRGLIPEQRKTSSCLLRNCPFCRERGLQQWALILNDIKHVLAEGPLQKTLKRKTLKQEMVPTLCWWPVVINHDWDQWSLIRIKPHSWHLVEQPWRPLALNQLQIQPDGGHWEEKLDWGTSREIEWKTEFEELTLSQKVSLVDGKIKISIYKCVAFCWQARGNQKHCSHCKTAPTERRKALF